MNMELNQLPHAVAVAGPANASGGDSGGDEKTEFDVILNR